MSAPSTPDGVLKPTLSVFDVVAITVSAVTPAIVENAPFAIDPLLEQQSAVVDTKNEPTSDVFWLSAGDLSHIPLQQPSPTFETEWAEMRRLIDIDVLVDKK